MSKMPFAAARFFGRKPWNACCSKEMTPSRSPQKLCLQASHLLLLLAAIGLASSSAASGSGDPAPSREAGQPSAVAQPGAATLKSGKILFIQCRACHTLGQGEPHLSGPNLWGLIGSPAAFQADYEYSEALRSSGIRWDRETLDAFIANPGALLEGGKMVFHGIDSARRRADLIAYLAAETAPASQVSQ